MPNNKLTWSGTDVKKRNSCFDWMPSLESEVWRIDFRSKRRPPFRLSWNIFSFFIVFMNMLESQPENYPLPPHLWRPHPLSTTPTHPATVTDVLSPDYWSSKTFGVMGFHLTDSTEAPTSTSCVPSPQHTRIR